jgi:hypothetical protein
MGCHPECQGPGCCWYIKLWFLPQGWSFHETQKGRKDPKKQLLHLSLLPQKQILTHMHTIPCPRMLERIKDDPLILLCYFTITVVVKMMSIYHFNA